MNKLKPCPFCGGKAEAIQFSAPRTFGEGNQAARPKVWVVRCIKNGCGTLNTFYYDKKLAIDLWNTRAERTCKYEFVSNIGGGHLNACGLRCTSCGREQMSLEAPKFCPDCGRKVVEA